MERSVSRSMQDADLESVFRDLPAGSVTQRIHVVSAFEQKPCLDACKDTDSPPGQLLQLYHEMKGHEQGQGAAPAQWAGKTRPSSFPSASSASAPPPPPPPLPSQATIAPVEPFVLWTPELKTAEWKLGRSSTGRLYTQDPAGRHTPALGGAAVPEETIRNWLLCHGLGMTRDALGQCKVPELRQLCKVLNLKRSNLNKAELLDQLQTHLSTRS